MKHFFKVTIGILSVVAAGNSFVQAQFRAPDGLPAGFHHALLDVLAESPSFYGRAKIQVSNGADKDPTFLGGDIAISGASMRLQMDSVAPSANLPAAEAANVSQMHSITILRPDINRMFLVFPEVHSYVELGYTNGIANDPVLPPKIARKPLGKEAVADLSCDKSHWDVTETSGEHYDITVWMDTNASSIPIQIGIGTPPTLVMFQNVHFAPPDSGIFAPPTGFTKYEGIQALIERDVQKAQTVPTQ